MRINRVLLLFRLAGVLAVPVLALGLFTEYYLFLFFWGHYGVIFKTLLEQLPALLLFVGTPIASYKKFYPFLWVSLVYLPVSINREVSYLIDVIKNPDSVLFFYMNIYAALAVVTEILLLIALVLWQYQKYQKRHNAN